MRSKDRPRRHSGHWRCPKLTATTLGIGSLFVTATAILPGVSARSFVMYVGLVLTISAPVVAADPNTRVQIDAPQELQVGARLSIPVSVQTDESDTTPVLLSATSAGRAINVVKGRLLRADAIDPHANPLRFELPVVAASPGVALLNITVLTYRCAFRCEAVRTEATHQFLVREP